MWKPGDEPNTHPLWSEQIALEWDMVQRGSDKYRERLAKARAREDLSKIRTFRKLLEALTQDTAAGIQHWLNGHSKRRGGKPQGFNELKGLNHGVAAYITVRIVLDAHGSYGEGKSRTGLAALGKAIGLELEHEAMMEAWTTTKDGKRLYAEIQKTLTRQKATTSHRARVNINRFNTLVKGEIDWHPWDRTTKAQLGLKLIEIMCKATGQFEVVPTPQGRRAKKVHKPIYIVQASPEVEQFLMEGIDKDAFREPEYMPTLMPPRPWENMKTGGYYTKIVRKPPLIRFKAHSEEAQGVAMEEYNSLDMPRVYSSINIVQEVPWRINNRVREIAWEVWERNIAVKKMARREPPTIPPQPDELVAIAQEYKGQKGVRAMQQVWIDAHPDAWKHWRREASKAYGERARIVSTTRSVINTLKLADRFRAREFYFPHMLDFRGRMYPIPIYLQPQGNDLARGLLTFAHGRPLGEHGGYWLAVNVANQWGYDKVSFDDRVEWVTKHEDLWRRIAGEPLKSLEWTQCANPWQALAGIFEFVHALDTGDDKVSALPIRVDGTCNGIQHLSAMMRDEVGGASVNLLPSDYPRDIYKEVAGDLEEHLNAIAMSGGEAGAMAQQWLDGLGDEIPRAFTKRQVMVMPYGGTKDAYRKYLYEYLKEVKQEENRDVITEDQRKDAVAFMTPHLWAAVLQRVPQGMVAMEWLKECAAKLAATNNPIIWRTPSGFLVRHFYGKLKLVRYRTLVDGKQADVRDYVRTKDLHVKQQLQGISPNYVHSMDGCANMETAIRFTLRTNAAPFTTIHDSFGTTAGDMWTLHDTLREAFVWTHSHDVLTAFRSQCVDLMRDHILATTDALLPEAWEQAEDIIPRVPERGSLDIKEVLNADYFFA